MYTYAVPKLSVEISYQTTFEGLVLHCDASGPPSTATLWYKDGVLISDRNNHLTSSRILPSSSPSGGGVVYRHSLEVFKDDVGIYSCDVFSKWITADHSSSGRTSMT